MKFTNYSNLIIRTGDFTIKSALEYINQLGLTRVALFGTDSEGKLAGSITEGDIRRALLNGKNLNEGITECLHKNCKSLIQSSDNYSVFHLAKKAGIRFLPLIDQQKKIVKIIDTDEYLGYLPFDVVLMAGGKGERLMPLTEKTPKPLLQIGGKAIIDYNVERLLKFGISCFHVTLKHFGNQIEDHLKKRFGEYAEFVFIYEDEPRGTAGSLSEVKSKTGNSLLFMNCDLLTNIDYDKLYAKFVEDKSDLTVASIQYHVDLPYAVFEFDKNNSIEKLAEKPRYSYETNAGIYLLNPSILQFVPKTGRYDATTFMEDLIAKGKNVKSFPLTSYWLDIGRHDDFEKAQRDISYIKFDE